jgi:hypothetical protein
MSLAIKVPNVIAFSGRAQPRPHEGSDGAAVWSANNRSRPVFAVFPTDR